MAVNTQAVALVSGDKDLTTGDADDATVLTPATLLELLESHDTPAATPPAETGPPSDT